MGRTNVAYPFDRLRMNRLMTTSNEHVTITLRLLEHADEQLRLGDLVQASEKGWGAAAHYLKAVAKQRGWRNESHRDFFTIKNRLARETDEPDRLNLLFTATRSLHQNFYEPLYSQDDVRVAINSAREFVEMLEQAGVMREPSADSLNGAAQDGSDGNI